MRQPAIPKLSELSTAGRAELLAIWTATLGKPSAALRTSRELLASALAWQLQERKFGGLKPATQRKLRVLARKKPLMPLPQPPINLRPGTAIIKQWRGAQHVVMCAGRWLSTPEQGLWQPLPRGPGDHRHALERPGFLRPAPGARTHGGGGQ